MSAAGKLDLRDVPIAALIPHAGRMCLLDRVEAWSERAITCSATSHLDPDNPLRRDGALAAICGVEYAMQAAAVHGALLGGAPQPRGSLAALRDVTLAATRLDDRALGRLFVAASLLRGEASGMLYEFRVGAADGRALVAGRAAIALRA